MSFIPSLSPIHQRDETNRLWEAVQSYAFNALTTAPQPRGDPERLHRYYVRRRRGDSTPESHIQRIAGIYGDARLGQADADLITYLRDMRENRLLRIVGERGAGKTSMLHFVESVLARASGPEPLRILIILNGNRLPQTDQNADGFLRLLREELLSHAERGAYPAALSAAAEILGDGCRREDVPAALQRLVRELPGKDITLVTVAFDNLDQHRTGVLNDVAQLAKEILLSSGLGSIITVRPATSGSSFQRAQYRAFFWHTMEVGAPAVEDWLDTLALRLEDEARIAERNLPADFPFRSPESVGKAIRRLSVLLRHYRPRNDDALMVLQVISSDNTRHLLLAVLRILQNRNLPVEWLLGDSYPEDGPVQGFHPLRAFIEGGKALYISDRGQAGAGVEVVPNLLSVQTRLSPSDVLIQHRILKLLSMQSGSLETEVLLERLERLGFDGRSVVECLPKLERLRLLSSAELDAMGDNMPLPRELFITPAGRFYLDDMLRFSDYLTTVVMDVPLAHQALQGDNYGADSFNVRFAALLEYADEVRKAEDRQIQDLARQPASPGLRYVAEVLKNGGLLSNAVLAGIEEVLGRGTATERRLAPRGAVTDRRLPAVYEQAREYARSLAEWLKGANKRLEERAVRGRRGRSLTTRPQRQRHGEIEVLIAARSIGDTVSLSIEVAGEALGSTTVLVLRTAEGEEGGLFKVAAFQTPPDPLALATPAAEKRTRARYEVPVELAEAAVVSEDGIPTLNQQVLSVAPVRHDRIGLFIVEEEGELLRVRLGECASMREPVLIGTCTEKTALIGWARGRLLALAELNQSEKPLRDEMRITGVQLAKRLLSVEGANQLASNYNLFDTVILCSQIQEIPWELLCPPAQNDHPLPAMGDQWRLLRWPASGYAGPLLYSQSSPYPAGSMPLTIGLPSRTECEWCYKEPLADYTSFKRCCQDARTLHLCGHWDEKQTHLEMDGLAVPLSAGLIEADGLSGPQNIVLSSCGAASVVANANLPIALTLVPEEPRTVWAPLIDIRQKDAIAVDEALAAFMRADPAAPFEVFMRDYREQLPVLSLYARYGIGRFQ